MRRVAVAARITIGGLLFAAAILMIMALPGFLTDTSSTVPLASTREAAR